MDIRYSVSPQEFKRFTANDVRQEFLVDRLFMPDDVTAVYSHADRIIIMGAAPVESILPIEKNIDCKKNLGCEYMLEHRELGIINIGGSGAVSVDGDEYRLERLGALYVSMCTKSVRLKSIDPENPAKFYMCSTPAHRACATTWIPPDKAIHRQLGALESSNKRTLHQYLHPDVVETNQLLMGCTQLDPGCVWNTMPCHTHERRMEVYMYFEISQDNMVVHFMGQPQETRHIIMRNEQAVISPSWSIHSGCGTSNYSFVWAMAGENIAFDDMDVIENVDWR